MARAWAPLRLSLVPVLVRPVAIVAVPAGQTTKTRIANTDNKTMSVFLRILFSP
jgi:hypothetical protein